jgi:hypothetical protein
MLSCRQDRFQLKSLPCYMEIRIMADRQPTRSFSCSRLERTDGRARNAESPRFPCRRCHLLDGVALAVFPRIQANDTCMDGDQDQLQPQEPRAQGSPWMVETIIGGTMPPCQAELAATVDAA